MSKVALLLPNPLATALWIIEVVLILLAIYLFVIWGLVIVVNIFAGLARAAAWLIGFVRKRKRIATMVALLVCVALLIVNVHGYLEDMPHRLPGDPW